LNRGPEDHTPVAKICAAAVLALVACSAAAEHARICSDYKSIINCAGKRRDLHEGADFRGDAGTEVISATHGTFVRRSYNECAGHGFFIRTDIVARHGEVEGPVYAAYWHAEALPHLKPGDVIKPGDPVARIIPLRGTRCYASAEHVHYELRVRDNAQRHIDPHPFWIDGPGKPTCYNPGMAVPPGKAVAPVRCGR
jgi:murein DD-endopeptidase MepM/ murein hydrolase activator NlpD